MGEVKYYACDCCGAKTNPKTVAQITISKKTWKKDVTRDICPQCVRILKSGKFRQNQEVTSGPPRKEDNPTEDDLFILEKQEEMKERKQNFEPVSPLETNNGQCPHMNKTRITLASGGRPYQTCKDCGQIIYWSKKDNVSLGGIDARLNSNEARIKRMEGS